MNRKTFRPVFVFAALTPLLFFPQVNDIFSLPKYAWIFAASALAFAAALKKNLFKSCGVFIMPAGIFLLWHLALLYRCVNVVAGIHSILLLLMFIVFCAAFENLASESGDYAFILKSVCAVTFAVSLYGLLQAAGYDPFTWSIRQSPLSTLGRRNFAAEYLAMAIPYLYYLIASAKTRAQKSAWTAVLATSLLHLLLTFTRASYLGFAASTILFLALAAKKKTPRAAKPALLLLAALLFLARPSFSAIRRFEKGSINSRMRTYAVALEMLKDKPVLGAGPGNFNILYPRYAAEMGEQGLRGGELMVKDAHNDFLETAVDLGIPGLFLFLFLLFSAGRISYILCKTSGREEKLLAAALASSILAVSVNALASFPFKMPSTTFLFWMNLALLGALYGQKGRAPVKLNVPALKTFFTLFFAAGCFLSHGSLSASLYCGKAKRAKGPAALQYAEQAVRHNPFSWEYNFLAGKYAVELREYEKALKYLAAAKKYRPYFNVIYNNLGIAYYGTGRTAEAEQAYLYSIKLNPHHADVYSNLGVIYAQAGKYDEAAEYFKRALDRKPGLYAACFNLGRIYHIRGDYQTARIWFEKTLEIMPGYPPAVNYLRSLP